MGTFPDDPKPVIRIVFALASREAGVTFPKHVGVSRIILIHSTAFDVWFAGLLTAVFKHIDALIDFFYSVLRPHGAFELKDRSEVDNGTKSCRGSIRWGMAWLTLTEAAHEDIQLQWKLVIFWLLSRHLAEIVKTQM